MILRNFKKEDAPIIAEWLRSEEELYKWSADRFNKYPLTGEDLNENYAPQIESGRFYPLTAVDENETIVGHFIIRYPRDDDDSSDSVWLCNSQSRYKGKRVRKRTASAWNRICKGTSQRQKD